MYLLLIGNGVVKAKKIKRSAKFLCQTSDGKFVLAGSNLLTLLPDSSIVDELRLLSNLIIRGMVNKTIDNMKIDLLMYENDPFSWAKAISIQRSNSITKYHGAYNFWWPDEAKLKRMEKQLNHFFEISNKLSKISHNNFIPKWVKDIKPYKTNMLLTKIEFDLAS